MALPALILREAANCGGFVFKNLKNGVELGDLEQVLHALVQVEQLQLPTLVSYCRKSGHEFSNAGAIDVGHVGQIEENLFLPLAHLLAQCFAENAGPFPQSNSSHSIHHAYITHLASCQFYTHGNEPPCTVNLSIRLADLYHSDFGA